MAPCWQRDCRALLGRYPDSGLPRFLLAAALRAGGDPEAALVETDRIVASGDARSYVFRLRAELFQELGQAHRAREAAETAARLEARDDPAGRPGL